MREFIRVSVLHCPERDGSQRIRLLRRLANGRRGDNLGSLPRCSMTISPWPIQSCRRSRQSDRPEQRHDFLICPDCGRHHEADRSRAAIATISHSTVISHDLIPADFRQSPQPVAARPVANGQLMPIDCRPIPIQSWPKLLNLSGFKRQYDPRAFIAKNNASHRSRLSSESSPRTTSATIP